MNETTNLIAACQVGTTPSDRLFLALLLGWMDSSGEKELSRKRAGAYLGLTPAAITQCAKRLQRKGVLQVIPQFDEYGGRRPNRFRVLRE